MLLNRRNALDIASVVPMQKDWSEKGITLEVLLPWFMKCSGNVALAVAETEEVGLM